MSSYWESGHHRRFVTVHCAHQRAAWREADDTFQDAERRKEAERWFCEQAFAWAQRGGLRVDAAAVAVTLWRRFFTSDATFKTANPYLVILACLTLAAELCDAVLDVHAVRAAVARKLPEGRGFSSADVAIARAALVARGAGALRIHTPYQMLQLYAADVGASPSMLQAAWAFTNDAVVYTDALLTWSPHIIALAALRMAATFFKRSIDAWMTAALVPMEQVEAASSELLILLKASSDAARLAAVRDARRSYVLTVEAVAPWVVGDSGSTNGKPGSASGAPAAASAPASTVVALPSSPSAVPSTSSAPAHG